MARPAVIEKRKVIWMARTGFAPSAIAERLGCSEKQIRRILTQRKEPLCGPKKDFRGEKSLWHMYRHVFRETESIIAMRFGVSRQAVNQYFKNPPQKEVSK